MKAFLTTAHASPTLFFSFALAEGGGGGRLAPGRRAVVRNARKAIYTAKIIVRMGRRSRHTHTHHTHTHIYHEYYLLLPTDILLYLVHTDCRSEESNRFSRFRRQD